MSPDQCRQAHAEMRGDLARSACETNRAVTTYRGQAISMFADFSTPRRSSQKCRPGSHSGTHPRPSHHSRRFFRSARVRVARDGSEFHRPKTYVALRRQTRKLPGESRMLRGGAGEIHQFFSDRIVKRTPAAGTQGRALLARVQVGQCRSLGSGDWAHTQESRVFCFFHFVHLAAIV